MSACTTGSAALALASCCSKSFSSWGFPLRPQTFPLLFAGPAGPAVGADVGERFGLLTGAGFPATTQCNAGSGAAGAAAGRCRALAAGAGPSGQFPSGQSLQPAAGAASAVAAAMISRS